MCIKGGAEEEEGWRREGEEERGGKTDRLVLN